MSKIFACPYCGKTAEEVTFKVVEEMPVYYNIKPFINEQGQVWFNYDTSAEAEPDWEAAEISGEVPYIRCPACDDEFALSEFVITEGAINE